MAIEVFNRIEKKYIINEEKWGNICSHLGDYMELDRYNKDNEPYTIANIYYDTPDSYLIRTSIQKPKYKEKLRIRAYGVPNQNGKVFLEIKKKVNGIVNKRRSALRLDEAYGFIETGLFPEVLTDKNRQVLKEVEYILCRYEMTPKLYLAYDRMAYFNLGSGDLRISFDANIRFRTEQLKLEEGDFGKKALEEGLGIMEIKTSRAIPIWLSKLLSEQEIYPSGFSKYGYIYNHLQKKRDPIQKFPTFSAAAQAGKNALEAIG